MNHTFQRLHHRKKRSPTLSVVALSLLLVACAEPDPIIIDTSGLNLDLTQAEVDAIFGVEPDEPEPAPEDDPDDGPAPLTYTAGPQSLAEFTDSDLSGVNFAKDTIDGQFYTRSNNTALLSGAVFGSGEVLNNDIRRIIPYTLNRLVDGIELEAVYLLKGNNSLAETLAPGQEMVFNVDVEFRGSVSSIRFVLDLQEGDRE